MTAWPSRQQAALGLWDHWPLHDAAVLSSKLGFVMIERWKQWARTIKRDAHALYLAARDPRVPWYAKAIAIAVAAYVASPIDLIPDFIPVLGYLDDLIIVPLGIALVIRLIPPEIMTEHRALATAAQDRPVSPIAAAVIVAIWVLAIGLTAWWASRYFWLRNKVSAP